MSFIPLVPMIALALAVSAVAADPGGWPSYRAGMGRAGYSNQALSFSATETWRHDMPAPSPAWTSPARRSYWQ